MPVRPLSRFCLPRKRRVYSNFLLSLSPSRAIATSPEATQNGEAATTSADISNPPSQADLDMPKVPNSAEPPVTPSQVLRFALTGTTRTSGQRQPQLDLDLNITFSREKSSDIPLDLRRSWGGNAENHIQWLRSARTLQDVQAFMTSICTNMSAIELPKVCEALKDAFLACERVNEYEVILATMNSLLVWLKRSGATEMRDLYMLGMRYASLCRSPQALRLYIKEYRNAGYGDLTTPEAQLLVQTLHSSVHLNKWEDPSWDTSAMLRVVTGLGEANDPQQRLSPTIHSILPWEESDVEVCSFVRPYVKLLGLLGDSGTLTEVWHKICSLRGPGTKTFVPLSLNSCLLAFLEAGVPEKAFQAAQDIISDRKLKPLVTESSWRKLLEHDYHGLIKSFIGNRALSRIFELELQDIESRFAIKWTGGKDGYYVDIRNLERIPNITKSENHEVLDDEVLDLESTPRLLAEIESKGSSRFMGDLCSITDLLHGHEGREIPLGYVRDGEDKLEVAWFPHCSSVEFSGSSTPVGNETLSPCSLGLIRARPYYHGGPLNSGRSLYLMQLGYLSIRRKDVHPDTDNPWRDSGHIVAWDRVHEKLLIIFIGVGRGTIQTGEVQDHSIPDYLPYHSASVNVGTENPPAGYDSDFTGLLTKMDTQYWFDLDPGVGMET